MIRPRPLLRGLGAHSLGLPSADPQAVRYDYTDKKVYIYAQYDSSAGDYHVRIEAKDSATNADVLNPGV